MSIQNKHEQCYARAMIRSPWPMIATLSRIVIVPLIVLIMIYKWPYWNWISSILFILASITDWLDGYLARKLKSVSVMGKLLDPVADKILVSSILIMLIPLGRIEALAVLILINRDVLISGIRSLAASSNYIIDAGQLGKWKTAVQMVAIPALLINDTFWDIPFGSLGYWGIWLSVTLSLISGFQYFIAFTQHYRKKVV